MRQVATIGAALFFLSAGAAAAADLPVKAIAKAAPLAAVYDWTGVYIGLNAGIGSSRKCWTIFSDNNRPVGPTLEGCHDATGALAGGQLGYRWQVSNWVFGLEAQGDWANLTGSNDSIPVRIPATNETRIGALGLFTGQIGYAWNNVLWYVKGGAALVDDNYRTFFTASGVVYHSTRETRLGGMIGTGLEFAFTPNWSVALEYDHLFMGARAVTFPASTIAVTRSVDIKQDVDIGTVRLNYRFGGPVVAKY